MKSTKRLRELKKIWTQVPPDYYQKGIAKNLLQRYWHTNKLKTFKKLIGGKSFKKVLDVGCASGRMANEISKLLPGAKITGIDPYSKAIKFGKLAYPNIKFLIADGHQLPFKKKSFDLVVCYEVIEHVLNPIEVLKEIKRVLADDGLGLVVMDSGNRMFRVVWWIWEKTFGRAWQGAHLHPFKHTELEAAIKKSGLKIRKKHFSHFGMEVSFVVKN
jgi:ubiquinone/menaquinone biosynthesis C-methylase UbiE